jgi:hypothetical protein
VSALVQSLDQQLRAALAADRGATTIEQQVRELHGAVVSERSTLAPRGNLQSAQARTANESELIARLSTSPDPVLIIDVLSELGGERSAAKIGALLSDGSDGWREPRVREAAIAALRNIGGMVAALHLAQIATHVESSDDDRMHALHALEDLASAGTSEYAEGGSVLIDADALALWHHLRPSPKEWPLAAIMEALEESPDDWGPNARAVQGVIATVHKGELRAAQRRQRNAAAHRQEAIEVAYTPPPASLIGTAEQERAFACVQPGEAVLVVGSAPSANAVWLDSLRASHDWRRIAGSDADEFVHLSLGVLWVHLWDPITRVDDYLARSAREHGLRADEAPAAVKSVLENAQLQAMAPRRLWRLVPFEVRCLELLRSVSHSPRGALLNEPFARLSTEELMRMREIVAQIARGRTLVCATSVVSRATLLGWDRMLFLHEGRVVANMSKPDPNDVRVAVLLDAADKGRSLEQMLSALASASDSA